MMRCLAVCRERCWSGDRVLDLDLKSSFDSLVLKAVLTTPTCGGSSSTWTGGSKRRFN
jgi:hypothetical protein